MVLFMGQMIKRLNYKAFRTEIVSGLLVFLIPIAVHAGFLSIISDFFQPIVFSANQSSRSYNSQNMALLEASLSPDPTANLGGAEITILDGMALVPEGGPAGAHLTLAPVPSSNQFSVYVVREGDTLSQIADMFGVSANTIFWANDMTSKSHIEPGQTLLILPITGVRHTVAKGDTLQTIAKKYSADIDEILEYNELSTDAVLALGDTLLIPDGEFGISADDHKPGSTSVVRGSTGPTYSGYYIHPVPGSIRTQGLHGYNAVDFGAPAGTPIRATAGGTIVSSRDGWNGGYGSYIVVKHANGTQSLYAHLSTRVVVGNQHVVQGEVIGYVGSSGRSTGPHLHFEIRGATNPF